MLVPPIVSIRPGRPADAAAIARVYVESWRSAYAGLLPDSMLVRMSTSAQTRDWASQLGRRRVAEGIFVADLASHGVIGFGSCGPARPTPLPHAGEIFTLYVAPEHQEHGVGRALLLRLADGLMDRGMGSALVWVLSRNPSRFFYEAMGGRCVAEKRERLWNATLGQTAYGWDDLRMIRAQRVGDH